jgi:hypothetical protein
MQCNLDCCQSQPLLLHAPTCFCAPDGDVFAAHGCPVHYFILGNGFTLIVRTAASTWVGLETGE